MTSLLESLITDDYGLEGRNRWHHSSAHDSLVYDSQKDLFFWNSKGIFGTAKDYLTKVRGFSNKEAEELVKNSAQVSNPVLKKRNIESVPSEKLIDVFWNSGKNKRDYWYKRLLTDDTIDRYRLGYYDGWYTIPLIEDGTFLNFQIRRDEPEKRIKYWYHINNFQPVLINSEILKFVDYIFITEGTVDSILLNQLGYPSVAQTGGSSYWNPEWYELFSKVKEIIYLMDNDKAGLGHARIVSNALGTGRVKVVTLGDPERYDAVNFFQDNRTKEEFEEICRTKFKYGFQLGKDK